MSEFDTINGKLDLILKRLGPEPAITPEPPVPMPHPEAPPPVSPTELPPSAFVPRGNPPSAYAWNIGQSFIAGLVGGVTYSMSGPAGRGYMVSITQNVSATLNGDIGGSTQIRFNGYGVATIIANENCEAAFDPI